MRDIVPNWLEDPEAYSQSANLELSFVLIVAVSNLIVGVVCVAVFEVFRRKTHLRYFWPKEALVPGSTPVGVVHGDGAVFSRWPLAWAWPLLRLDEEEILRSGGYDALIYLRFISMSLKIFGCFAPYAFVVLLPINIAASYKQEHSAEEADSLSHMNSFNRLSMSNMPKSSRLMWAHCAGVVGLTGIAMHWLARECRWYMRVRHRFLTETGAARQRTILIEQLPRELRTSNGLASYFAKLYPNKVVGVVLSRRVGHLAHLVAQRDAAVARHERCAARRAAQKKLMFGDDPMLLETASCCGYTYRRDAVTWSGLNSIAAHSLLEDAYDPLFYTCNYTLAERAALHSASVRRLDEQIDRERKTHAKMDPLVGRCPTAMTGPKEEEATIEFVSVDRAEDFGDDGADDDEAPTGVAFEDWDEVATEGGIRRFWPSDLCGGGGGHEKGAKASEGTALLSPTSEASRVLGDKAFVTFSAFAAAAVATQVFHAATPGGMEASPAPEARDIVWSNLRLSSKQRTFRKFVANGLVVLLLIFYVVPVTLLNLVLSESALKARSETVRTLCADSFVVDAAVKMFQPMALIGLMLLLPPAFLLLGFWEGHLAWSTNTATQLSRYYSFQITNVLLVTTVAGSFLKVVNEIFEDPSQTFVLLGMSLPQVCAFFSCYIFIKAFAGLSLELCRGVAFGQHCLKRLIYPSATRRDRAATVLGIRDFDKPGWFSYGKYGAQDLLVVVLLMTYCVMAPIILVPGLIFFAWAAVVYRHQLLYVYEPIFESGGILWPRLYRRTLFSLFILHFTMVGLFFLKHAFYQGYVILALSAATYLYKMRMKAMYTTSGSVDHHLPMELAVAVDEAMAHDPELKDDALALLRGLREYLQPALRTSLPPSTTEAVERTMISN